jgi:hypothetical protein
MAYFVIMEEAQHPVIGFGLEYAGQLIYCEAIMQENYYDVHFDGEWKAAIAHNDDMEWSQASGVILPQAILDEIGFRIDSNYK